MSGALRRLPLAAVSLATALTVVLADFNDTHTFNPSWPGHARFHSAAGVALALSLAALSQWLIWRRGGDRRTNLGLGSLLGVLHWVAVFPALLVPGASLTPDGRAIPAIAGVPANLATALLCLALAALGYAWAMWPPARRPVA
jgi:hypothetical protein